MNLHSMNLYDLYCAGALVAVTLFQSWTSRINQFFFFARTAPAGFEQSAGAQGIVMNYRMRTWLGLLPAIAAYAATEQAAHLPVATSLFAAVAVQSVVGGVVFALAHRDAGRLLAAQAAPSELAESPAQAVEVPLSSQAHGGTRAGLLVWLAPLTTAVVWGVLQCAESTGPSGLMATMEANKADFLCGLGLGLLTACVLLYALMRYRSRQRTALGRFTAEGAAAGAWLGAAAIIGALATVPLHVTITRPVHRGILLVVFGLVVLRMVYACSRNKLFVPAQVERNGDQYWRWGLFYCNPSDPALFIQNRSAPGYTVNFANYFSWLLTALFLADLIYLAIISVHR